MHTLTRSAPASDAEIVRQTPQALREFWTAPSPIVKLGHAALRKVAAPVARVTPATRQLVQRMDEIMRTAHGQGLAAPQIALSTRVIVYDAGQGLRALINPKIIAFRGEQIDPPEGCLSIPGLQGRVRRAQEIRVKALDEWGKPVLRRVSELEARVIQHEIDHLDGILFIDRVEPETLEWIIGDDPDAAPAE